jgi:hypothetical protein
MCRRRRVCTPKMRPHGILSETFPCRMEGMLPGSLGPGLAGRCPAGSWCTGTSCSPPSQSGRFRWGRACTGKRWSSPSLSGRSQPDKVCSWWTQETFDRCPGRTRGTAQRRSCPDLSGTFLGGMICRHLEGSWLVSAGRSLQGMRGRHLTP